MATARERVGIVGIRSSVVIFWGARELVPRTQPEAWEANDQLNWINPRKAWKLEHPGRSLDGGSLERAVAMIYDRLTDILFGRLTTEHNSDSDSAPGLFIYRVTSNQGVTNSRAS